MTSHIQLRYSCPGIMQAVDPPRFFLPLDGQIFLGIIEGTCEMKGKLTHPPSIRPLLTLKPFQ